MKLDRSDEEERVVKDFLEEALIDQLQGNILVYQRWNGKRYPLRFEIPNESESQKRLNEIATDLSSGPNQDTNLAAAIVLLVETLSDKLARKT